MRVLDLSNARIKTTIREWDSWKKKNYLYIQYKFRKFCTNKIINKFSKFFGIDFMDFGVSIVQGSCAYALRARGRVRNWRSKIDKIKISRFLYRLSLTSEIFFFYLIFFLINFLVLFYQLFFLSNPFFLDLRGRS